MVDGAEHVVGRDFTSLNEQPFEFSHEDFRIKFRLSVEFNSSYVLEINGINFHVLPEAPINATNPMRLESFKCDLEINDEQVHKGMMPWIIPHVKDKISMAFHDSPAPKINSVQISNLDCAGWVFNDFFGLLANQEFGNTDLKKLSLRQFKLGCIPSLDETIDQLALLSMQLQSFTVCNMKNLSTEEIEEVAQMTCYVIEAN